MVFGKADRTPVSLADVAAGNGGFVITGIDPNDYAGYSVSGAGDVNGDCLADLIVGARNADPGGNSAAGESYVVFGKADTTPVNLSDVAAGSGGFVINGINPNDRAGRTVSGAGDVNGDGLADLIVGAHYADPGGINNAGESYVVFGKADTTPVSLSDVAAGSGGFVINGRDQGDLSGGSVSRAGDVNGDGLADLIVGARGGHNNSGESYVVFGKVDTTPVNLSDVVAGIGGFVVYGAAAFYYSGASVSGAGDVNGDGLADLIIGTPDANIYVGVSHVVFGKSDTTPVFLGGLGLVGFVINGIDYYDGAGISVSGAGDLNGDGLADLLVGARNADPDDNTSAGESYVVFGKVDATPVYLSDVAAGIGGFVINGIDAYDLSGDSVSDSGDVNGDGVDDLIIGAQLADPGGIDRAGESYVIFGPSCPWDCADGNGQVGIADFLALLAQWGGPGACDFDGDGVGIVDFLNLLAHWGACP